MVVLNIVANFSSRIGQNTQSFEMTILAYRSFQIDFMVVLRRYKLPYKVDLISVESYCAKR